MNNNINILVYSHFDFHFTGSPVIKQKLEQTITKYVKQELKLNCDAVGSDVLTYSWVRNGSQLTSYVSET